MPEQKKNSRKRVQIAPVSELIKKPFLNEAEVAAITGRSISTLRNERFLRKNLNYTKISGRTVRYRLEDVMAFMEGRRITFTSET